MQHKLAKKHSYTFLIGATLLLASPGPGCCWSKGFTAQLRNTSKHLCERYTPQPARPCWHLGPPVSQHRALCRCLPTACLLLVFMCLLSSSSPKWNWTGAQVQQAVPCCSPLASGTGSHLRLRAAPPPCRSSPSCPISMAQCQKETRCGFPSGKRHKQQVSSENTQTCRYSLPLHWTAPR